MNYLERAADVMLSDRLDAFGAVLLEGPKWCGKTTTASQQAKSIIKMQDTDNAAEYLATAATKPSLLLRGENPRLIDEWQDAPNLWDAVRDTVDNRSDVGLYILTGSTVVDKDKIKHSGTGRIARMKMYPMSLWESKESSGEVSLRELFYNPDYSIDGAHSPLSVEDLIFLACRGGWPASLYARTPKAKLLTAAEYVNTLCNDDISRVDGVQRDERTARMILRAWSRNIATLAKKTTMCADLVASEEYNLSIDTFDDYVTAFTKLFVIDDLEAWCPPIRSKSAIRSGLKREFTDPSIAVAAIGAGPNDLIADLKTLGFLFETLCVRDLRVFADALNGGVYHYRDKNGLECDAVIHLRDGRYGLVEIKLGGDDLIDEGAETLLKLSGKIDTKRMKAPSFMMVLVGVGKYAYRREDGVYVVPVGCLKD